MSRNSLEITVPGIVGTMPALTRNTAMPERTYCRFRLAYTPRVWSKGAWKDGDTIWFTVKAWGEVAEHVAFSFHKGEPVLLTGRFSQEPWTRGSGLNNVLTMTGGGHDVTWGLSCFTRVPGRRRAVQETEVQEAADPGPATQALAAEGQDAQDPAPEGGEVGPGTSPCVTGPHTVTGSCASAATPEGAVPRGAQGAVPPEGAAPYDPGAGPAEPSLPADSSLPADYWDVAGEPGPERPEYVVVSRSGEVLEAEEVAAVR